MDHRRSLWKRFTAASANIEEELLENEYFVHESSYVDENVEIGKNTKIWHFCHIQSGARIGKNCSFGQNVNV
ncbi:MAG: hypothetical protein PUK05_06790, partial [Peptoniphilaceae bacterium]|nr:hypothetical protein [Peptoniphilaceae bacterium]MDY5765377.1 hypothetical protein [Peptoniphilaceae bacterium]